MLRFYELAEVVQASNDYHVFPDFEVTGYEFDSRKITVRNLFIPLKGQTDGHDYLNKAMENGAAATLWSKDEGPENLPYLKVDDVEVAFQQMAKYYLNKIRPKVVAVTGSNGKTTTKDMTAFVLSQKYETYKTQGNFNNNLGLPYTILHMPETTEMLVLEMGMDHEGEIDFLTRLATPDAAAITLIGESHLEYFKDRLGIAKAKMEIVHGLKADGFLLAPGDEQLLPPLLKKVTQKVHTFQLGKGDSELFATILKEEQHQTRFTLSFLEGEFTIPLSGSFNVKNALIAAYFGQAFGVETLKIKEALRTVVLTQNRSQWLKHNEIDILSDVYNANPTAMSLVLKTFSKLESVGNKYAVLGDMLELGATSPFLHAKMAEELNPQEIQEVFLYGAEMKALYVALKEKYPQEKLHYYLPEAKSELIEDVKNTLKPHDFVVVKASNGMHLDEVVKEILTIK